MGKKRSKHADKCEVTVRGWKVEDEHQDINVTCDMHVVSGESIPFLDQCHHNLHSQICLRPHPRDIWSYQV